MKNKVSLFLLIIILISQSLIVNVMFLFTGNTLWLRYVYTIVSYLCIAVMLWKEKEHLEVFHLDRLSLLIIILSSSFFRTRLGVAGETYYLIVIWLLNLVFLVIFIRYRSKIPKTDFRWLLFSILITFLCLIPVAAIESFQPEKWLDINLHSYSLILVAMRNVIYQLSFVSPLEEILFRGFLWGYLRQSGWDDKKACWGQFILFWLIHSFQIGTPITFFITLPIGILIFSLLVRYSKQLAPSIIAHTILNAFLPIAIHLVTGI